MMEPIQVQILDSSFNRVAGSIPYVSLTWERRYYEPGQFMLVVDENLYSPDWAYVYTDARPELGMIQSVEIDDSSHTEDGVDRIVLTGFFAEERMNWFVFLVEQTEQEAYLIPKPMKVVQKKPKFVENAETGEIFLAHPSADGSTYYTNVKDGSMTKDPGDVGTVEIRPGQSVGTYEGSSGYYTSGYNWYTEDGKLHSVNGQGKNEKEYTLIGKPFGRPDGTGEHYAIYLDDEGQLRWVTGVANGFNDTYYRRVQKWEEQTEGLEKVQYSPGGTVNAIAYREVRGAYQLRTDIGDVGVEKDNVQQVIDWAQLCFGNQVLYDEVGFVGEKKVLDPSLKRAGDLFYEEMKTIQASVRLFYDFESNTFAFSVWRGMDRTKTDGFIDEGEHPVDPDPVGRLPEGFTELQYVESSGTQYVSTGFTPNQNTRVVCDYEFVGSKPSDHKVLFGSRKDYSSVQQYFFGYNASVWRSDYGTGRAQFSESEVPFAGRHVVDKNKGDTTLDGLKKSSSAISATMSGPMYVFAGNTNGSATNQCSARVYSMQVYNGQQLARDLVPAKRDEDGAVGFYDLSTQALYVGQNGNLIAGPEVEGPVDPTTAGARPWAVFSDTWGTLYGYSYCHDESGYRNKCYVMYDFDEPAWNPDGSVAVGTKWEAGEVSSSGVGSDWKKVYYVPRTKNRGYKTVRLDDGQPDKETWLDLRDDKPEGYDNLPDASETYASEEDVPDLSEVRKESWDAFRANLEPRGRKHLQDEYPMVDSLDTGTLWMEEYMNSYDLGDLVDMDVSKVGMARQVRITGVTEVYESSGTGVNMSIALQLGEEKDAVYKRVQRN